MSEPLDAESVVKKAEAAMSRGAVREAIEAYEEFADRGALHPDVSYNRGAAYLARVRAGDDKPGDLGRAAAGFEEARLLRFGDRDAERALERVREEVARRKARGGENVDVAENPSALRAVVTLAPEPAWAALALLGSLALSIGLVLRRASRTALHLAGGVAIALGVLVLGTCGPLAFLARADRESRDIAVVVSPDARLVDEKGAPAPQPALPEAARVDVLERRGGLVRVRWGTLEGFTAATNVRVVRPRGSL